MHFLCFFFNVCFYTFLIKNFHISKTILKKNKFYQNLISTVIFFQYKVLSSMPEENIDE